MAASGSTPGKKPKPSAKQQTPAPASGARATLEDLSRGPLTRLHRMPRWTVPVIMGVLLLAGLLIRQPWAGVLLVALALFLGWLLALSWPQLSPGSKVMRLLVIAIVIFAAYRKFTGIG